MAYEQDARQMLINRLRNVYEQEGEGLTGGAGGCPVGYRAKMVCKNKKTGRNLTEKSRRNFSARVRYHMKKGLTRRQAEIKASNSKPVKRTVKRKETAVRTIRTKRTKKEPEPPRHPAYGLPCKDFKGATAKRTGCIPEAKPERRGDASLKLARKLRLEDPTLTWNEARKKATIQLYGSGSGLRYNPNYGGPGHMDGGVMLDSDYGGVLLDHFYD